MSVPYTFSPGTVISSTQVNANFAALSAQISGLNIPSLPLSVAQGGTGGDSAAQAQSNLLLTNSLILPMNATFAAPSGGVTKISLVVQNGGLSTPTVYTEGTTYIFTTPSTSAYYSGPFTVSDQTVTANNLPYIPLVDASSFAEVQVLAAGATLMVTAIPYFGGQAFMVINTPPVLSAQTVLSGSIIYWPSTLVPPGYFECNGQAISRTTYGQLLYLANLVSFAAPWGPGDGSTTFNIPDLRGVFLRGYDDGKSYDPGRTFGTYQVDNFASHSHSYLYTSWGSGNNPDQVFAAGGGGNNAYTGTTQATGASETRPKNVALLPIIKY